MVESDAEEAASYDEHVATLERAQLARTAGIVVLAAGGALLGGAALRYALVAREDVALRLLPFGVALSY
jgi:hypothetical protein